MFLSNKYSVESNSSLIMSALIEEFNNKLINVVSDNCYSNLVTSDKLLTRDLVIKIHKELMKEKRRLHPFKKEELKTLLDEMVERINNSQEITLETFQNPEEINIEDIETKITNFQRAYNCFIHDNNSSCNRAYELGCVLHDLKEKFFVLQFSNPYWTWAEFFKEVTTQKNIKLSLQTERRLRSFYINIQTLPKLRFSGLTYTDLSRKLKQIHNGLIVFPNYTQYFL